MADEEVETNSPISASESTPPRVGDPLEMISQPSPPEEQRVISTDRQQFDDADSPDQLISSTTDQEPSDGIISMSWLSAEEGFLLEPNEGGVVEASPHGQSSSDSAPEIENRPQLGVFSNNLIGFDPESKCLIPTRDGPGILTTVGAFIEMKRQADTFHNMFFLSVREGQEKDAADSQTGSSRGTAEDTIKRNVHEENSDNSEQQFDVKDLSSASKSSPKNMDLGSSVTEDVDLAGDSSRTNASVEEERNLRTSPTKNVGIESSLGTGATKHVALESKLGISATENVGFENIESKSSPLKTGGVMQDFGKDSAENVGLKSEPSPTKKSAAVEESSSV